MQKWIDEYFYANFDYATKSTERVIDTSLVGLLFNALSHLNGAVSVADFAVRLTRGLTGNCSAAQRADIAKQVLSTCGLHSPDAADPANLVYNTRSDSLMTYADEMTQPIDISQLKSDRVPLVLTASTLANEDTFAHWLKSGHKGGDALPSFIIVGPEGCGKT
jgi:hypothetical protein